MLINSLAYKKRVWAVTLSYLKPVRVNATWGQIQFKNYNSHRKKAAKDRGLRQVGLRNPTPSGSVQPGLGLCLCRWGSTSRLARPWPLPASSCLCREAVGPGENGAGTEPSPARLCFLWSPWEDKGKSCSLATPPTAHSWSHFLCKMWLAQQLRAVGIRPGVLRLPLPPVTAQAEVISELDKGQAQLLHLKNHSHFTVCPLKEN